MTWNVPKPTARFAMTGGSLLALCVGVTAAATSAQHAVVDGFQFPGLMIGEPLGLHECPWKEQPFIGDDPTTAPIVERQYLNDGTQVHPCYAQVASIGSGVPVDGHAFIAYPAAAGIGDHTTAVVVWNGAVVLLASLRYVEMPPQQRMDQLVAQLGAPAQPGPVAAGQQDGAKLQAQWSLPGELVLRCELARVEQSQQTAEVCRLLQATLPEGVQLED